MLSPPGSRGSLEGGSKPACDTETALTLWRASRLQHRPPPRSPSPAQVKAKPRVWGGCRGVVNRGHPASAQLPGSVCVSDSASARVRR